MRRGLTLILCEKLWGPVMWLLATLPPSLYTYYLGFVERSGSHVDLIVLVTCVNLSQGGLYANMALCMEECHPGIEKRYHPYHGCSLDGESCR